MENQPEEKPNLKNQRYVTENETEKKNCKILKTKEVYLLCRDGQRTQILSGKRDSIEIDEEFPIYAGLFQTNSKLYLCGGVSEVSKK